MQGLLSQEIDRCEEELVSYEVKLERLKDDVGLGEGTAALLQERYLDRMCEVLERYHGLWAAHDLMFRLYFDQDTLEKYGYFLDPPREYGEHDDDPTPED